MYLSFALCIDRFKYCKSVISIDETHLYGQYQGKLLIALATDANKKVFSLAFAVVDIKSRSRWRVHFRMPQGYNRGCDT